MIVLDKYGWPVELFKGRPITNFLRRLIHGRSIVTRAEWMRRMDAYNKKASKNYAVGAAIPTMPTIALYNTSEVTTTSK